MMSVKQSETSKASKASKTSEANNYPLYKTLQVIRDLWKRSKAN
jgi:hypothetical protein